MPVSALVGVVGGVAARVDAGGGVRADGLGWPLDWWIGADDRWRVPAREAAVRQSQPGGVPVVETAMRVPGGDAVPAGLRRRRRRLLVVEIENDSPAPFVAAFVVSGAHEVALDGRRWLVDGAPALVTARAPSRWFAATGVPTFPEVEAGRASAEPFRGAHDRRGRLEVAWLHPVAHRTTLRAALLLPGRAVGRRSRRAAVRSTRSGAAGRPSSTGGCGSTSRTSNSRTRSGSRAPSCARRARPRARGYAAPGPETVAALEDWGFDAEAASAWERLRRARAGAGPGAVRPRPPRGPSVDRARDRRDGPGCCSRCAACSCTSATTGS